MSDIIVKDTAFIDESKEETVRNNAEVREVGKDEIDLKFVFANRDGSFINEILPLENTVLDVKEMLRGKWPADMGPCPSGDRLR